MKLDSLRQKLSKPRPKPIEHQPLKSRCTCVDLDEGEDRDVVAMARLKGNHHRALCPQYIDVKAGVRQKDHINFLVHMGHRDQRERRIVENMKKRGII